jgi:hypothetical protein
MHTNAHECVWGKTTPLSGKNNTHPPGVLGKVRLHIMIVNTVTSFTLHDIASGRHWFVVAWFIEPDAPDAQMGQHDV